MGSAEADRLSCCCGAHRKAVSTANEGLDLACFQEDRPENRHKYPAPDEWTVLWRAGTTVGECHSNEGLVQ